MKLVRYEQARRALQEARSLEQVKDIGDRAKAMAVYARQAKDPEVERWLSEIRFLAYLRLGELSLEIEGGSAGRPPKNRISSDPISRRNAWKAAGVARGTGVRAVRLAKHAKRARAYLKEKEARKQSASVSEFLRQTRESSFRAEKGPTCTTADLEALIAEGFRFGTIYADPPWPYGNQGTRAATKRHYDSPSLEWIAALPIAELVADAAHLHLWTTNGFLFDARQILEAWGFSYKSCFVWVKPEMGIGNYWRVSHEFMLLGVRGSCPFLDRAQKSWLQAGRTEHSAKPEGVRAIIEKVSPAPRLELFARQVSPGWVAWGNDIKRGLFDGAVREIAA